MKNCGTCKWLGKNITVVDEDCEEIDTGYRECNQIKHDYKYMENQGALTIDGSGYWSTLCVEKDFGCVKHEEKDDV